MLKSQGQKSIGVGILPHILFLSCNVGLVVWMKSDTRLPLWAAILIVSPQTALVVYSLLTRNKEADEAEPKHRRFEIGSGVICAFLTLLAAIRASSHLFLAYLYGFARVQNEHLRFTAMPKGRDWIVSNGDRVSDGHFLHYLMGMGIWMALFPVIYGIVYRCLPERQEE
jgi:hypothetical protein